jgi:hypothetical protein
MEWVGNLIWLEHRKIKQLVGGRHRQCFILVGGECREAVSRLRSDHNARSATGNNVTKLL